MSAMIGHNSKIKSHLDKLEPLQMQINSIKDDMKEYFTAAKQDGVKPKILRRLIKERLMSDDKKLQQVNEDQELAEMKHSLGMLADTPLGAAAMRNV